jgi:hypothetical protein
MLDSSYIFVVWFKKYQVSYIGAELMADMQYVNQWKKNIKDTNSEAVCTLISYCLKVIMS